MSMFWTPFVGSVKQFRGFRVFFFRFDKVFFSLSCHGFRKALNNKIKCPKFLFRAELLESGISLKFSKKIHLTVKALGSNPESGYWLADR